jgi:hypothetical protein
MAKKTNSEVSRSEKAASKESPTPTETVEVAIGPNVTGHNDQAAAAHALPDTES